MQGIRHLFLREAFILHFPRIGKSRLSSVLKHQADGILPRSSVKVPGKYPWRWYMDFIQRRLQMSFIGLCTNCILAGKPSQGLWGGGGRWKDTAAELVLRGTTSCRAWSKCQAFWGSVSSSMNISSINTLSSSINIPQTLLLGGVPQKKKESTIFKAQSHLPQARCSLCL